MRRGPAVLRITAAVAWGVTTVGAFTGFDSNPRTFSALDFRIWVCMLSISLVASLAALQDQIAAKACRLYVAMTKASVSSPPCQGPPSGPMRIPDAAPLRVVQLPTPRHARDASPRRARA